VIVAVGILVLRQTKPDLARPFKIPAVWIVAPLTAITSLLLMASLPFDTWLRLIIWMAIGIVIYFVYGRSHSKLNNQPED
jgi:APA family basic amino acid/polyamine antiporter